MSRGYSVLSRTTGEVKRGRRCTLCQREIKPGDRYERIVAMYDGELATVQQCVGVFTTGRCIYNESEN